MSGRPVWKRHRTARSIAAAYFAGPDGDIPLSEVGDIDMGLDKPWTVHDFIRAIRNEGKWGFTETKSKPPVIHWWHDGKRDPEELAHLLGHELGHITGKKKPYGAAEEQRADEYGLVAREVVRRLFGKRGAR